MRAAEAARAAIASPLLDVNIDGARGVLFNVTGGNDMTLFEVNEAAEVIAKAVDPDANIIFGTVIDPRMENEVKITVIATGFDGKAAKSAPVSEKIRQLPFRPFNEQQDLDIPPFLRKGALVR